MALRIVQLGSPRLPDEGLRIGTVRRPPRGVRKEHYAAQDWYDVWLPELAPSDSLLAKAQLARTESQWAAFRRAFRTEMKAPTARHLLSLLAALSAQSDFSVGCYCADENHCHRSELRELLRAEGARLASA
jgi:uncharacterized protein YeaO (DUF488 family)